MDGDSIRLMLRSLKLSYKEVAAQLGVKPQRMRRWLRLDALPQHVRAVFKALSVAFVADHVRTRELVHEHGIFGFLAVGAKRMVQREEPKLVVVDERGKLAERTADGGWLDGWVVSNLGLSDALDDAIDHKHQRKQRSANDDPT